MYEYLLNEVIANSAKHWVNISDLIYLFLKLANFLIIYLTKQED